MIKFSGQTTGGGGGATPDASETVKGKIRIATSAEAITGTNDLIAMTPKTVTDLIDAAVLGLFDYKGALDASQPTTPDISSGLKGDFYRISVAGTIYGKTWAINDALVINADMGGVVDNAKIDKFDNTDAVTSVNTQTGAVVLDTADVAENTNLYYTDGRVDAEVGTLPLSTLSDVDYTAGAGIDGDVLTWVNASSEWQAVTPVTAPVTSVNTQTGAVVLDTADVSENTNLYYTDGRVDSEVATLPLSTLSDVTYTAGPGIDGDVLTWVNASSEWQAVTPASGGLAAVVNDTSPQLGGDLDVNSHSIVSVSNGDINLAPNGTGIIKTTGSAEPDANLTRSIGSESLRYLRTYSDVDGAIIFKGKNDSGVTLTKGQAVYVKGVSGTVPTVDKARANSASTMPAFGLVYANANDQAEVQIVTFGNLTDVNTTTYSLALGDTVYISAATAGSLSSTAPSGETNLIQNIGRVIRADASAGIIKVGGAGRSNATPNLDLDKIFVGNATHQTVSKSLSAIGLTELNQNLTTATVSENTNLYYTDGRVDTRAATLPLSTLSDVDYTAGAGIDGKVLTYVHASTEWQAVTPATAPVTSVNTQTGAVVLDTADVAENTNLYYTDGRVDTEVGTLPLSTLSDVDYTAGAGIDGKVLTYVHGSTEWQAVTPATAPVTSVNTQTGAVVLDTADIAENTNLYYTDGRVDTEVATLPLSTLSDVDYTGGAGIDGKVLTYVHASSEWQAVTASGGGSAPTVTAENTTTALSAPGAGEIEQTYTVNSASAVVLTLVSAATTGAGFKYQVKRLGAGSVTAQPAGSEYIDYAGQTSFAVGAQYDSITLQSDGTNWILI